jgi:cell division protein FtsI/penicillin-binding protein 2
MLRLNLAGEWFGCALVCLAATSLAAAKPPISVLQRAVTHSMAGRSGTAVVLDVHTGQVLASYRMDVAAQRVVHPGSSIKPFTVMALLDTGKVDAGTALMCKRSTSIGGHRLDCTHPVTTEPLDPATALAYSCNSYFTAVALRLTPTQLQGSFLHDGFTSTTALVPKEVAGSVALAHSPEQLQLEAIGEWGISVTPLELLRGYRQIALEQTKHDAMLAPLFDGLQRSVSYGMGHAARPDTTMRIAGKTGTASADEGPWTHAWFAGYAPAENPEIVLVVFLEKGHGGSDAAGVAREIFAAFAQSQSTTTGRQVAGARP